MNNNGEKCKTSITHIPNICDEVGLYSLLTINFLILTPVYMVYFDYLVYMRGGGAKKKPGLTLAFDFRQS